jgi:preprotein translocase subunit SecG
MVSDGRSSRGRCGWFLSDLGGLGSGQQREYPNYAPDLHLDSDLYPGVQTEESRREAGTIKPVLTWIIGALHLISAFSLVGLVLLHSGKGGGVSDMFGGSVGATAAGSTVAEKNLSRITVVVAVTFGFTTLILGLLLA